MRFDRRVAVFAIVAAVVAFLVVQDRVTAGGARRYVTLQEAALAGGGVGVTIDEVMGPAVREAVVTGLAWSVGIAAIGLAGAAIAGRSARRG